MSRTSVPPRRGRHFAVLALALALTGCSAGEPRSVGPAGVDGLEIPTPTPDPQDFVRVVDNPYLPLVAGSEWVYDRVEGGVTESVTVSVSGTRTVEGVTATEVTTVAEGRSGSVSFLELLAQDREGNVWSFGGDDWLAGRDGAQAGLVMPATPRVGDGFRQQYAPGVAEDRSQVLDTATSVTTAYDSWTDLVEVLETSDVPTGTETRKLYAPGVGLVLAEEGATRTELVSYESAENP
ncbi:MAG: hypothetical protein JWN68_2273 [Nocardioides sp.]|jgi:hypothetical protein|uniref:hypothetical protein n=1 Tax=Nocardioides sp. TaxID=35761 RepID=UPI00260B0E09|nr:hypothetical protein [Nocardioides sp.]MCW2834320.1 hypothetical protein [Nocardioides sp.]